MCDLVKSHIVDVFAKAINTSAVKSNKCVTPRSIKKPMSRIHTNKETNHIK